MALTPGTRFGVYEVTALIGAGGMGEVYRARDTKLDRDVALKVLPDLFAYDSERLARFEREAKVLASLNHPNIAIIHGLEESGETRALVLEYVEGPTLADRIAQGPIALDEALPITRQIADALEAAHEQGVIHRDLKPANVKVKDTGVVKVLDFGLAKALAPEPGSAAAANLTQSPTITSPPAMTGVGVLLGTAAYMSPEQAKGWAADKRSDIWAFGCVLYEMLTGKRAFGGEDVSDTLAAVLRGEPDWAALPATTPTGVRTVLHRCLEKDRKKRLRDIADAAIVIEDLATPQTAAVTVPSVGSRRRGRLAWGLAAVLLGTVIGLAALVLRQPAARLEATRFSVLPPKDVTLTLAGGQRPVVLSPDGRRLVFVALGPGGPSLWVRDLDALDARPLPGTEGASYPFWSPDSRTIGFFANAALKTIDASGGPVRTLCAAPGAGRGGAWSRDGLIIFASTQQQGLFSVSAAGGQASQVTSGAVGLPTGSRFPSFLPDGRRFLFRVFPNNEVYLGSLDSPDTAKVLEAESQVQVAPQGYLLFVRQGALVAQPFDAERGRLAGESVPLAEQMSPDASGYSPFSASDNGHLTFRSGVGAAAATTQLTWFDRDGKVGGTAGPPGRYRNPVLSPDRSRVAVEVVGDRGSRDIWLLELARGVLSRLTFDPGNEVYPVWSPDGSRIAFGSDREGGTFSIYQKPSDGSATEELLFKSTNERAVPYSWSPDGRFILHRSMNGGFFNTGVLPVAGDRKSALFQPANYTLTYGDVSPDGRWMAYQSNESGRNEIFVQTFPTPEGKWQVSMDGGLHPMWRGDGREIFYYAFDGQLTAVPVTSGTAFEFGRAVPLFKAQMLNGPVNVLDFKAQYDVTPDGQRFLLNVPVDEDQTPSITVVLNWTAGLTK